MRRDEIMQKLRAERDHLRAKFGVESLALFGSVARDEAGPGSDVDLLVEFARPITLFDLVAVQQYLERYNCTQEELAGRLKIDRSTIANLIRLLELPEAIQQSIRSGALSQGHARALLPLGDERDGSAVHDDGGGMENRHAHQCERVRHRRAPQCRRWTCEPSTTSPSGVSKGSGS